MLQLATIQPETLVKLAETVLIYTGLEGDYRVSSCKFCNTNFYIYDGNQ